MQYNSLTSYIFSGVDSAQTADKRVDLSRNALVDTLLRSSRQDTELCAQTDPLPNRPGDSSRRPLERLCQAQPHAWLSDGLGNLHRRGLADIVAEITAQ
jgi:hypothetical protein